MKGNKGFTLIELMIVIAIIAIIAAIAIPGLLQSQRASNERNASASLKSLTAAQADFRSNDRDGNRVNDFWVLDVAGLYGICPGPTTQTGTPELNKLIEISVAGADFNAPSGGAAAWGNVTLVTNYTLTRPKAGYWYRALLNDEDGIVYAQNTGAAALDWGGSLSSFNHGKFGFISFPDSRSSGRSVFLVNEGNTIVRRQVTSTYVRPGTTGGTPTAPPVSADFTAGTLVGSTAGTKYPNDTEFKTDFSKID